MTPQQIADIRRTFAMVAPVADTAAGLFYDRLFARAPAVRGMFPQDLAPQRRKLMGVLATAVGALDRIEELVPTLRDMGARHAGYGVTPDHYPVVGAALLETLEAALGDAWTMETADAWGAAYSALSGAMLDGAAAAQAA